MLNTINFFGPKLRVQIATKAPNNFLFSIPHQSAFDAAVVF